MHDYGTIKLLSLVLLLSRIMLLNIVKKNCERFGKNLLWTIENSCEVLDKLKSGDFCESSQCTYDFLNYILPCSSILLRITLWT